VPTRGIALIDPRNRRKNWLISTRSDGRRIALPFVDSKDAKAAMSASSTKRDE
jgi:hypothetical protein